VFEIYNSECLEHMKTMTDNSIDCCITDPPYGMGMEHWDHSVPTADIWKEVLRILKPGGFCLSFCSPQLYHRMACAVEDAGFKIQDQIMWMITTNMPKKNRLKQAHEPIVVAQKPFKGSIKSNFEKWGVGQIDTANTRIPWDGKPPTGWVKGGHQRRTFGKDGKTTGTQKEFGKENANPAGRYPSNIIGEVQENHQKYFYAPRVTRKERGEYNDHPTPKPISLMSYLIRVYCPEGKTVLDPFNGSGSTGIAAVLENRRYIGIEMSEHYCEVTKRRIADHTSEKE
jgi:site-specific DNA-methyltransferase (adenine-specific)